MKEFNLEEAKAGKAVCTRNGKSVRIICFDMKNNIYPIVALIAEKDNSEECLSYTIDGKFNNTGNKDDYDLMMAGEKKEGWINIYPDNLTCESIYETKEEAVKYAGTSCIATIEITWEE